MEDIRGKLKKYQKIDIAMEHLNLALKEYVAQNNMFSVIHLAGAAEEMLGKVVCLNKKESALDNTQNWFRRWYSNLGKDTPANKDINKFILKTKNGVKHIKNCNDLSLEVDAKREAKEIIRRAIENFNQLPELTITLEIIAYHNHEKHNK